ncbi:MAG: nucleoside recognition domain-containing protein [Pseudomonadota bacterium]|nr:nucleoside recognition domain-containing protein [Pseudomonadota bacterium]
MNFLFYFFILISFLVAGWRQLTWVPVAGVQEPLTALTATIITTAGDAVQLAIGLVGVMALFLGLMKVAEEGGLLKLAARGIRPILIRLFPEVPADHPAMGAMVMNLAANLLGLGNAATPFGIKAMQELETLNPEPGTATDAMALFLAINTSSVTLLPTGVIALRAAAGSTNAAGILPTTLCATLFSTATAIICAKLLARLWRRKAVPKNPDKLCKKETLPPTPSSIPDDHNPSWWKSLAVIGVLVTLIPLMVIYGQSISGWIVPGLMVSMLTFGFWRKVPVYEAFVNGARDGFQVAIKIIPYLVAIMVAIGMLRGSGVMEIVADSIGHYTAALGMPAEALPMAILRPLSGSGAYGILAATINNPAIGPDSYTGYLVSTLQGSTETTFYVMAVYFGAVQIKKVRHTLAAGLLADLAGVIGAIIACKIFLTF